MSALAPRGAMAAANRRASPNRARAMPWRFMSSLALRILLAAGRYLSAPSVALAGLEMIGQAGEDAVLRHVVDEAVIVVVGVDGAVADGGRKRWRPHVADRHEALRGELRTDA